MRSTAYSVMMTLLLLVPISAVPLMAIFGVPQFTPLVTSPLDEPVDEEWDRPARKKIRSAAQPDRAEDDEDAATEEALDWADDARERPRSRRISRPKPRPRSGQDDVELSFADSEDAEEAPRERRPSDTESSIQLASNEEEASEEESPFAQSAVHEESQDTTLAIESSGEAKIPGYRRQRSHSLADAGSDEGKSGSKKKKSVPLTEELSWLTFSQRLNDYGIRNFRLESGEQPNEYLFVCTYTPSNSPHVTRRFEAIADHPLKAVAKVLAQVEEAAQQKVMASPRKRSESRRPRGED